MVEPLHLAGMVERLAHWGPDAIGRWHDGGVGLAQLTLWSTPEARGEPGPFRDAGSGVVIAADARIDNRDDLFRLLTIEASMGTAIGDVELIARAYAKWGTECLAHLVGDFAFALWDPKARRLFCARDPMGVRPFFYFCDDRRFLFGSEIKAIFTDPEVPRDHDLRQFALALSGIPTMDDRTSFRAIRSLEPASMLCLDTSGLRVSKYWRLDLEHEIRLPRDEDYVDAFEEILQRAINARLRTTGRVGCLLSGGLDATTCLGMALRRGNISRDRFSAFSWALPEGDDCGEPDERPYIEAFLRENPLDHHYIFSDAARLFDLPPEMHAHRDGPEWRVDHCQMAPTFAAARAAGVRVLLHGAGGDETVSYMAPDYVLSRILAGDWCALWAEVQGQPRGTPAWRKGINLVRPFLNRQRWRTPFSYQWVYRRRCERVADLTERGIPLQAELLRETDLVRYVREVARPRMRNAWHHPTRATQIYLLTQVHVMSDQLASWDYAPSYGLECRFPYLDRRVIEYAVAMPPQQHRHAWVPRRLLRRVAARYLPAWIAQRRDKSNTMPDLGRILCEHERAMVEWIAAWRGNPRVERVVDLDRLELDLRSVVQITQDRSAGWAPALPLCRGVLCASYLASKERLIGGSP
jgi:asparagine synthase (glutamine-hydrolysing)